jgi:hypothetical protein
MLLLYACCCLGKFGSKAIQIKSWEAINRKYLCYINRPNFAWKFYLPTADDPSFHAVASHFLIN